MKRKNNNKQQSEGIKQTKGGVKEIGFFHAENYLYSVFNLQEVENNPSSPTQKRILSQYLPTSRPSFFTSIFILAFTLYTTYQILYGIYNNVQYSLWRLEYLKEEPEHDFQYFIVDKVTLNFTSQPHAILLLHSIFGGVFLLLSFIQTYFLSFTLSSPQTLPYHKQIGKICLISSLISSFCACILSANAIHGTELTYLLGTSSWFFFTLMTFIRIKQKNYLSHSRWANALQQVGVMFTTTRIIAPLAFYFGISKEDSYHYGVLGAGALAHFLFYYFESNRLEILNKISSSITTPQPLADRSFMIYHRIYMWSLGTMAFVLTPLLRFTSLFDNTFISVDLLYKLEATMLIVIILFSIFHSKSQN